MNLDTLNLSDLLEYALFDDQELEYYNKVCDVLKKEGLAEYIFDVSYLKDPTDTLTATKNTISKVNISCIKKSPAYQFATTGKERADLILEGHSPLIDTLLAIRVEMCKDMPELERMFTKRRGGSNV